VTQRRRKAVGAVLTATACVLASATVAVGAQNNAGVVPLSMASEEPPLLPTPRAECGPGSIPEPGMQGRVPADDVAAGGAAEGYRCNTEVVGRFGISGGFKVERYVDAAGNECAYYDTTLLFPTNATAPLEGEPTGVAVLDMADPANPVLTATLETPAMLTPHESLLLHQERGLLVAVAGNPVFAPGILDVYDVTADCRAPVLRSSTPLGILGHESGFSPDGNTYWAASLGAGQLTAVDLTDPALPRIVYTGRQDTHALTISDDGNRAYLAAGAGFPRNEIGLPSGIDGLVVLDVSQVQSREPLPEVTAIGATTWSSVTIPQAALPVTIGGRPYLVEMDEFSYDGNRIAGNGERVGAGRIIDIGDETDPRVVSNLRLEVHQPENRPALAGDPDATSATGGYAGHYCAVPQRDEPGIVACSFLASGLRVFDIRDPLAPKEIAYFVAPVEPGGSANAAFSSASFVPERNEIWYSDGNSGFWALRLTNDVWPTAAPAPGATQPPAAEAPPGAAQAPQQAAPRATAARLPATGLALPVGAALVLLAAAGGIRLLGRRHSTG
jgi:hypothetical protein